MSTEKTKQSAQEFLAEKLTQDFEAQEAQLNLETATRMSRVAWNRLANVISQKCKHWNQVTGEETLVCKETLIGDLRIRCAGRPHQLSINFDPSKLLITLINSARAAHETDVLLYIEGCRTETGRDVQFVHSGKVSDPDTIILAGMSRQ